MGNRSAQCGRLQLDGTRCTRPAGEHGYCDICWNLGLARARRRRRK